MFRQGTFTHSRRNQVASKSASSSSTKPYTPILSADLLENESAYQVHVDLPGVNKADLEVSFNEGITGGAQGSPGIGEGSGPQDRA